MAKLRPIDDTRRADGSFTSETSKRMLAVRGGRARAKQQAADGYSLLNSIRAKAILTNRAKAASNRVCQRCRTIGEILLKLLAANPSLVTQLDDTDRKLLG